MSTRKQKKANQKNAQKSTGPKSVEGKQTVAQNAMRHGLTSKTTKIMSWESQADFDALRQGLFELYKPVTVDEILIFERIVSAEWNLQRVDVYEAKAMEQGGLADIREHLRTVTMRLRRYATTLRRELKEDKQELRHLLWEREKAEARASLSASLAQGNLPSKANQPQLKPEFYPSPFLLDMCATIQAAALTLNPAENPTPEDIDEVAEQIMNLVESLIPKPSAQNGFVSQHGLLSAEAPSVLVGVAC